MAFSTRFRAELHQQLAVADNLHAERDPRDEFVSRILGDDGIGLDDRLEQRREIEPAEAGFAGAGFDLRDAQQRRKGLEDPPPPLARQNASSSFAGPPRAP